MDAKGSLSAQLVKSGWWWGGGGGGGEGGGGRKEGGERVRKGGGKCPQPLQHIGMKFGGIHALFYKNQ